MTGFPRLGPDDLDPAQRELYLALTGGPRASAAAVVPVTDADGRLEGPFNALLYAPDLGHAVQAVGARIRYGSTLSDRERELVTLLVAGALRSGYELAAHRRLAAAAGVAAAEIETLAAGRAPDGRTDRERAILRLGGHLLAENDDDALVDAVTADLGHRAVVEVTVLVGYYRMLALLLDTCGGHPA